MEKPFMKGGGSSEASCGRPLYRREGASYQNRMVVDTRMISRNFQFISSDFIIE